MAIKPKGIDWSWEIILGRIRGIRKIEKISRVTEARRIKEGTVE